jgi:hypothetical protein
MRTGDVISAGIAIVVVLFAGTCWMVNRSGRTNANLYPFARPPANLDSAARLVEAAATLGFKRHGRPVRTVEELGDLRLPPGVRIERVKADDSVSYVYLAASYRDTVLHCHVISRIITDSTAERRARALMYSACDNWYPRTEAEREEYYRMERERQR